VGQALLHEEEVSSVKCLVSVCVLFADTQPTPPYLSPSATHAQHRLTETLQSVNDAAESVGTGDDVSTAHTERMMDNRFLSALVYVTLLYFIYSIAPPLFPSSYTPPLLPPPHIYSPSSPTTLPLAHSPFRGRLGPRR
jgi:hypothetical protein